MSVPKTEHINATQKQTGGGSASTSCFTEKSTFTQYRDDDWERYEEDSLHNFGQYGDYDGEQCPSDDEGQSYGYDGSMVPSDEEEAKREPERQTISVMRKKRKVEK